MEEVNIKKQLNEKILDYKAKQVEALQLNKQIEKLQIKRRELKKDLGPQLQDINDAIEIKSLPEGKLLKLQDFTLYIKEINKKSYFTPSEQLSLVMEFL